MVISQSDTLLLRDDVMFSRTEKGVLFVLGQNRAKFEIRGIGQYQLFRALVPFLRGNNNISTILSFVNKKNQSIVLRLLTSLIERNCIVLIKDFNTKSIPSRIRQNYANQIRLAAHFCDTPYRVFNNLTRQRIVVDSESPFAQFVSKSLVQNGIGSLGYVKRISNPAARTCIGQGDSDTSIYIFQYKIENLCLVSEFIDALPETILVMPILTLVDKIIIGPIMRSSTSCHLKDAILSVANNTENTEISRYINDSSREDKDESIPPGIWHIAGIVASFDLFKLFVDPTLSETNDGIIVVDASTGEAIGHKIAWICDPHAGNDAEKGKLLIRSTQDSDQLHHRAKELSVRVTGIVDPFSGLLQSFSDDDINQTYLQISKVKYRLNGQITYAYGWSVESLAEARANAAFNALSLKLHEKPYEETYQHTMCRRDVDGHYRSGGVFPSNQRQLTIGLGYTEKDAFRDALYRYFRSLIKMSDFKFAPMNIELEEPFKAVFEQYCKMHKKSIQRVYMQEVVPQVWCSLLNINNTIVGVGQTKIESLEDCLERYIAYNSGVMPRDCKASTQIQKNKVNNTLSNVFMSADLNLYSLNKVGIKACAIAPLTEERM